MKIKTLIVDDEAPARARIRRMLADETDVEIVDEAANGDEWLPCTIFTTAFAEHAVTAFELHALDYLLKPYTKERFGNALARAREKIRVAGETPAPDTRVAELIDDKQVATQPVERFLVRNNERYLVVRTSDIESAEAAANYVVLHTREGNHVLRRTLTTLEAELDPNQFFRLNRSCIVRLSAIREIQTLTAGEFVVFLQSGAKFTLTRGLRELQDKLSSAK